MLNLVLFGPPGAGKGTQAEFLTQKFNLMHLSTGDMLRRQIAAETPLGLEAKSYIDKGFLVPDSIVIDMIRAILQENKKTKGYIFDGFPRTVDQAIALDELLNETQMAVSGMLSLEVDKEELIKRLLERGKVSGRTDDQDVSIIENRIQVYHDKTMPLKNYYESQNKCHKIQGIGSIEDIAGRLEEKVASLLSVAL